MGLWGSPTHSERHGAMIGRTFSRSLKSKVERPRPACQGEKGAMGGRAEYHVVRPNVFEWSSIIRAAQRECRATSGSASGGWAR